MEKVAIVPSSCSRVAASGTLTIGGRQFPSSLNPYTGGTETSDESSLDPRIRTIAYATIQQRVNRHADWIPLVFGPGLFVYSDRIQNYHLGLFSIGEWTLSS